MADTYVSLDVLAAALSLDDTPLNPTYARDLANKQQIRRQGRPAQYHWGDIVRLARTRRTKEPTP